MPCSSSHVHTHTSMHTSTHTPHARALHVHTDKPMPISMRSSGCQAPFGTTTPVRYTVRAYRFSQLCSITRDGLKEMLEKHSVDGTCARPCP